MSSNEQGTGDTSPADASAERGRSNETDAPAEPDTADRAPLPDPSTLRAMGIDNPNARSDADLLDAVGLLVDMGLDLDELCHVDFGSVGGARMIRKNPDPAPVVDADADALAFLRRARVALGLPLREGAVPRGLTADELAAAEFFGTMAGIVGEDEVIGLLRVIGSSASRVARAVVSLLRLQFETPLSASEVPLAEIMRGYFQLIDEALPPFLDAWATIMRLHLAEVVQVDQEWSVDRSGTATLEPHVVGFADLVGFTAFTEQANAEEFMRALVAFEENVQEAIVESGGTLVKLIGDEVMFVAPTAEAALEIAQNLSDLGRRTAELEGMRVGLAYGDVINNAGDYFGTVVNTAARIVNLAFTHAVVVTRRVVDFSDGSARFESIGMHDLRGIREPVELFRLRP